MIPEDKLIGTGGCQIVTGTTPTNVSGFAYGLTVRVADTQIKSVTQKGSAVTDKSWESVALYQGEFISFATPISAITLNAATDSVMLWLQPTQNA